MRAGRFRQDCPALPLGAVGVPPGGLAFTGRGRQRAGTVLAPSDRRARPDSRRARAGLAARLGPLLDAPAPSADGLVAALINELAAQPEDMSVLVLDDYHLVETEAVHRQLAFLLAQLPSGLRLVLATRSPL